MISLYNTLTRKKESFKPLHDKTVKIYSCGPTVYDHVHIGNLSAFICADILRRLFSANNYQTTHVMNFTDVDDKTIQKSKETYPNLSPENALKKLTTHFEDIFLEDTQAVGNDVSNIKFVRATQSITAMQDLISQLYKDGFAYLADDGIYFSISKYRQTGKKYGQLLEITKSDTSKHRISNDEYDKESINDFALWKTKKSDEPSWEFELNSKNYDGRPGWHIECSAMSSSNLSQPFDIHTGGVDLIFPHHENEIAQSTASTTSDVYANFFIHNEHMLVDGKKMSKSLNNFYKLDDITKKGYSPLDFRMMILQSHYKNQTNFTWEGLEAAHNRLNSLKNMADLRYQPMDTSFDSKVIAASYKDIINAMNDDMNTPQALSHLSNIENYFSDNLVSNKNLLKFVVFLRLIDDLFGFKLLSSHDINDSQKKLMKEREVARFEKDWALADKIRTKLLSQNISIRDTDHGQIWSKI